MRARASAYRSSTLPRLAALLLTACLLPGCIGTGTPKQRGSLEQLLEWIVGDFDNRAQFEAQADGDSTFSHLGLQRRLVIAPAIGEHVVYAQINRRADPGDVYRQSLQVFERDARGNISSRNLSFAEPDKYRDIIANPNAFAALRPTDLVSALPDTCNPGWQFNGEAFEARIQRDNCIMISRRDGKPRHIQSTEFVYPGWIRNEESGYRENGEQIFGLEPGVYYQYDRQQKGRMESRP